MTAQGGDLLATVDVHDYLDELQQHRANRPQEYHPATAREPRRALTRRGALLAGGRNGEGVDHWGADNPRKANRLKVHVAVTGWGYAYGASVAACDGAAELGEDADPGCLVDARSLDQSRRCQRPGCRTLWALADTLLPAPGEGEQDPPTEGDRMT